MKKVYCAPIVRTEQIVLGVFGNYGGGNGHGNGGGNGHGNGGGNGHGNGGGNGHGNGGIWGWLKKLFGR